MSERRLKWVWVVDGERAATTRIEFVVLRHHLVVAAADLLDREDGDHRYMTKTHIERNLRKGLEEMGTNWPDFYAGDTSEAEHTITRLYPELTKEST